MEDTLYFFVNKHIYTVDSYWCIVGFLTSTLRRNGVDISITLDAANWNCAGGELSSCVTNIIILDHVSNYSEHFWNKLTSGLLILFCFMYLYNNIYMIMFLMYCGFHA